MPQYLTRLTALDNLNANNITPYEANLRNSFMNGLKEEAGAEMRDVLTNHWVRECPQNAQQTDAAMGGD